MVSGRPARSRKSGPGSPEVVNDQFFIRNSIEKWMGSGRLARSRKSGQGGPEVVNEKFDKTLNREVAGVR